MSAVIPFQISVGGRGATGYGLRATGAGQMVEARLELPALPSDPTALGLVLGQALFPPVVRQLLIELAREADEADARLQIQLHIAPPELAVLPWEWATLGGATPWSPAIRDDYPLVRVGRAAHSRSPLPIAGPLRLLVACAPGPAARAAGPLGHALTEPVQANALVIDLLRDTDQAALRVALSEEPCHVLHLVVADATGTGQAAHLYLGRSLDAAGLVALLKGYPDLRLLTLAADPGAEPAALATVAVAVNESLGLTVIALGELSHAQAGAFCGVCYAAIAAGAPTDLAVTDGRAALEATGGAWGVPRLWVVPGGERLFTQAPAAAAPAAPQVRDRRPGAKAAAAPEPTSAPVGTPLRARRAASALGHTATKALATARAFVVDATTVGEPAQRARPAVQGAGLLQPKLVILLVACLILALIVSQVLPGRAADTPVRPGLPTPTVTLVLLRPTIQPPSLPTTPAQP
ncbi:MAG: polysaccharide deacetylase [Chloroflexales bacterium]